MNKFNNIGNSLSKNEVRSFIENGYLHLKSCLDPEFLKQQILKASERLKIDPLDNLTWPISPLVHMPATQNWIIEELAPKAWGAICDLLGGAERVKKPSYFSDNFIINFSLGKNRPWLPPSSKTKGWHKDGDFFWHFLDSPEQALLVLVIWEDILPEGGGTFLALDSIQPVAKYLYEHPEGLHPFDADFGSLVLNCEKFHEVVGNAGDVILIHPYMLHSSSQNLSGIPRFITNPVVSLNEPLNLSRHNMNEYSPVEFAILNALKVNRSDFSIKGKRRPFDHSGYNYLEVYWPEEYKKL